MAKRLPDHTPAFVAPADIHMGLDIARSLGRRGIPVRGVDADRATATRSSRYLSVGRAPDPHHDPDGFVDELERIGRRADRRAVLYALSDDAVLAVSRHRDRLLPWYAFVMPEHAIVERLLSKDGLAEVARSVGIASPITIVPRNVADVRAAADEMRFPVILKPTHSSFWQAKHISERLRTGLLDARAKVIVCEDAESLIRRYEAIAEIDDRLVIQEVIPGPDDRLVYFASYTDRSGAILGQLAGRKLRVLPTGFGSASFVRSIDDPTLTEQASSLIVASGYAGLGGIEFKEDPRDGRYRLVEFNVRFGMWDGLGTRCGVDLPYIAYRDALDLAPLPTEPYRRGVIWVDLQRDGRAFLSYRRAGTLTLRGWLASMRGERMVATFARDDPLPAIISLATLAVVRLRTWLHRFRAGRLAS